MTLYLGCPVWGIKRWVGNLFPAGTAQKDYLRAYSRRFQTVEGNTTFYGMPEAETIRRWCDETPDEFRFCLKFPQAISHRETLRSGEDTDLWLARVQWLGNRAGPCFLQLPPRFHPGQFDELAEYLAQLPKGFLCAVEIRHAGWFQRNSEARLDALLEHHGVGRVLFDTRGLRGADLSDPLTQAALAKKPNVPLRKTQTASFTFVRYISDPNVAANAPFLDEWAVTVADWLHAGTDVYFFLHGPDDFFAPELCRDFHMRVSKLIPVPPLPEWDQPIEAATSGQMRLF